MKMTSTSSDGWARYYHVILGRRHFDIVKAVDEQDAIRQVERKFGPARKWDGKREYIAILCRDTP
jgi:hypothetical protein